MTLDDFQMPSEMSGGIGGAHPALSQLAGRLVWILPTSVEYNVTTPLKKTPHTKVTCDVAFLDGAPIDRVLKKDGSVAAMLIPPVQPGQVMTGRWVNQDWFTRRLADKVGKPGFPGIVGVVATDRGRTGNTFFCLKDPTPEQMAQVKAWFQWKMSQPAGAANYVPAPPAPPVPTGYPVPGQAPAYGAPATPQAPVSPFAQPPAQYPPVVSTATGQPVTYQQAIPTPAGYPQPGMSPQQPSAPPQQPPAQPMGPWAPQVPAGAQVVQQQGEQQAPAPAPQPGPGVPPWQR